jgi:hypothetical protein
MSLLDDPDYLPFKLDLAGRRVLMLRLTAGERADAAFLDERALPAAPQAAWVPLSMLADVTPSAARSDFIFHIGHCGSTLLARLLQSWPACQVLREPLPLRTLAGALDDGSLPADEAAGLLHQLVALWSRPLGTTTRTLLKATSSCNGLIAPILASADEPRSGVLLLDMPLAPYLATLLKSQASIGDALAAETGRRAYLAARIGAHAASPQADGTAERCALGWLSERVRFHDAAQGEHAARVLRVDFERLLAAPGDVLAQIASHLQLPHDGVQAALDSPAWLRYSKADAYAYDAADRQHDLALSARRFAAEIEAGERWLDRFLKQHPQLAIATA